MPDSNEKLKVDDSRSISSFLGIAGMGAAVFAGGWHLFSKGGITEALAGSVKGVTNADLRASAAAGVLLKRQEELIRPGIERGLLARETRLAEFQSQETFDRFQKHLEGIFNPNQSRLNRNISRAEKSILERQSKLDAALKAGVSRPKDIKRLEDRVLGAKRMKAHFEAKANRLKIDANDSLLSILKSYSGDDVPETFVNTPENTKKLATDVYKKLVKGDLNEASKLFNTVSIMSHMASQGRGIAANADLGAKFKPSQLNKVSDPIAYLRSGGFLKGMSQEQIASLSQSSSFSVYTRAGRQGGSDMTFVTFGNGRMWSLGEANASGISSVFEYEGSSGGGILSGILRRKTGGGFEEVSGSSYVLSRMAEASSLGFKELSASDEQVLSALYSHRTSDTAALWQMHGSNQPLRAFAEHRLVVEDLLLDPEIQYDTKRVTKIAGELAQSGYIPAAGSSAIETVYKFFGFDKNTGERVAEGFGKAQFSFNVWDERAGAWDIRTMGMADWFMKEHGKFKDQFELYRVMQKSDYLIKAKDEYIQGLAPKEQFFKGVAKTQAKFQVSAGVVSSKQFQDYREVVSLAQGLKKSTTGMTQDEIIDAIESGKLPKEILGELGSAMGISPGSAIGRQQATAVAQTLVNLKEVDLQNMHFIANIGAGQALGSQDFMNKVESIEYPSIHNLDELSSDVAEKIIRAKEGEVIQIGNLKPGQQIGRAGNRIIQLAEDGATSYRAEITKKGKGYHVVAYGQHKPKEYLSKHARSMTGAGENLDRRLLMFGDLRGGLDALKRTILGFGGGKYTETAKVTDALLGQSKLDFLYGEDILSNAPKSVLNMVASKIAAAKGGQTQAVMIESSMNLWAVGTAHIGNQIKGDVIHAQMMRNMGLDFMIPKYFAKMTSMNREGIRLAAAISQSYQEGSDVVGNMINITAKSAAEIKELSGGGITSEAYLSGYKYKSRTEVLQSIRERYGSGTGTINELLGKISDQEYYYMPGARSGLQEKIAAAALETEDDGLYRAIEKPLYSTNLERDIRDIANIEEQLAEASELGDERKIARLLGQLASAQHRYATTPGLGLTGKASVLRNLGPVEGGNRFTVQSNINAAKSGESIAEVGELGLRKLGFTETEIEQIKARAAKNGNIADIHGALYSTRWPVTSGGFYQLRYNADIIDQSMRTTTLMDQLSMIDRDKDVLDAMFFKGEKAGGDLTQQEIDTIFAKQRQLLKLAEPISTQFKSVFDYIPAKTQGLPPQFDSKAFEELLKTRGVDDIANLDPKKLPDVGILGQQYDALVKKLTSGNIGDDKLAKEFSEFSSEFSASFGKKYVAEAFAHKYLFEQTFIRKIGGKGLIPQTTNMIRLMDAIAERGGVTEMGDAARVQLQLLGEALFQFPIHSLKHADAASMLDFAELTGKASTHLKKGEISEFAETLGTSKFFKEQLVAKALREKKGLKDTEIDAIMASEELSRKAAREYFEEYFGGVMGALRTAVSAGTEEYESLVKASEALYSKTGNLEYMNRRMANLASTIFLPKEILKAAGMSRGKIAGDVVMTALKKHPAVALGVGGGLAGLAALGLLQSPSDQAPLIAPTSADKEAAEAPLPRSPADAMSLPKEPTFLDRLRGQASGGRYSVSGTSSYDSNPDRIASSMQKGFGNNNVTVNVMNPYDSRTSIRTRRRISGEQQ